MLASLPPDSPRRAEAVAELAAQAREELSAQGTSQPDDSPSSLPTPASRSLRGAAAALTLALLVPSLGLYLLSGTPEAVSPAVRAAAAPSLDELVAQLRERLVSQPDDARGWALLGRTELTRGDLANARSALERALTLAPRDPQIRADLADAIAQAQGNRLEGRPIELLREALADDPKHPKALALAGAYEVSRDQYAAALTLWRTLLQVLPPDSPQAAQIAGYVADLQAGRRPGGEAAGGAPPADAGTAAAAPGASRPEGAAAAGASATSLSGTVSLSASMAARVDPSATLFVVARQLDERGQPTGAPLAVLRTTAAQWPVSFALGDEQAMSPMARLSTLPANARVMVVARVSRSGEAATRPGDLIGRSEPVKAGAQGLQVVIDTVSE